MSISLSIPLVDLKAQYSNIKSEVHAAIDRVLHNAAFILGDEVRNFEKAFATHVQAQDCVGVASGTAALVLALRALDVGRNDEVITTGHTFMATAEAISLLGATPVFVDIEPRTYNLDPDKVEAAITPRTRAILPVHLYGHSTNMEPLLNLADEYAIALVEDAAQAHGAEYRGRRCGGLGHLACFSFFPGKNLGAYGDGGAVTSNDPALIARIRKLRNHGRSTKYEHDEVGYGERLDALQAAVLAVKLSHLEAWTELRRSHAERYRQLLDGLPLTLPYEAPNVRHVYHLFVIRTQKRDDLYDYLRQRGIEAGIHYPVPLYRQPAYLNQGYKNIFLPETEKAAAQVLSLPIYPEMTDMQITYVANTIREFFR